MGHGFVRAPNGTLVTFDVPVGVNGTVPSAINAEGVVTGFAIDVNFVGPGFLRLPNGALTTFHAPGDVNGTTPTTITADGVILGWYFDANFIAHGFLRSRAGTFTEINGPGGAIGLYPFNPLGPPLSINPQGVITGTYFEPIAGNPVGGLYHVFVRSEDGEYITFDAANYPPCCIWSAPPASTLRGRLRDRSTTA
jgi:hypothetical protein